MVARLFVQLDKKEEAREREFTATLDALKSVTEVMGKCTEANGALQAHREEDIKFHAEVSADVANLRRDMAPLLEAHKAGHVSKSELSWKLWALVVSGAVMGLGGFVVVIVAVVKAWG